MLQFESKIAALNPAHPTTLSEILTADSWSANNHSALLFFQIVYIVSLSQIDIFQVTPPQRLFTR